MPKGIYKRKSFTKEHRENLSKSHKGKKLSEYHIKRLKESHFKFRGKNNPAKRFEAKEKISKAMKGRKITWGNKISKALMGDKSPNWKGDKLEYIRKSDREKIAGRKKPEQCEICGAFGKDSKKGICFDHDHKTGKFRGWICIRCNLILGYAKDKVEILQLIIKYLKK